MFMHAWKKQFVRPFITEAHMVVEMTLGFEHPYSRLCRGGIALDEHVWLPRQAKGRPYPIVALRN